MATNSVLRNLVGAVLATGIISGPAMAFEVNFEETHGTVIDDEYQSSTGLTVSAKNTRKDFHYAVAYDPAVSGRDADLEQPFENTKAYRWDLSNNNDAASFSNNADISDVALQNELKNPGANGRHLLIVQENSAGCSGGVCDNADDQAGGPNFLIFDFEEALTLDRIDIYDIDESSGGEAVRVAFYEGNRPDASALNSIGDVLGADHYFTVDNTQIGTADDQSNVGDSDGARFFFGNDGLANIRHMVVAFTGSGAITGLAGRATSVPEPGTLLLLAAGFAGMVRLSRQRSDGA